jgi:hypothetical protein
LSVQGREETVHFKSFHEWLSTRTELANTKSGRRRFNSGFLKHIKFWHPERAKNPSDQQEKHETKVLQKSHAEQPKRKKNIEFETSLSFP